MALRYHLDSASPGNVRGWALDEGGDSVSLEVIGPDGVIASGAPCLPRRDVADAFPTIPSAKVSGFSLPLSLSEAEPLVTVKVRIRAGAEQIELGPEYRAEEGFCLTFLRPAGLSKFMSGDLGAKLAPFPKSVAAGLVGLWPELREADWASEAVQNALVDRLPCIVNSDHLNDIPELVRYLRFLNQVWAHFKFVHRYFPDVNFCVDNTSKDRCCKACSAPEMMGIANHLYVLQSYGVDGDFAEFGCFKGFSSSMLSYACDVLGIRMKIFDSFEGLPSSDSIYYAAGDFAGSLTEVKANIERFGRPQAVSFHKGFFSDTLTGFADRLMMLWMDVDLGSSATDAMTILDRVDERGAVFSHECKPVHFADGEVVPLHGPDQVVGPIVDAFGRLGRPIRGRMMTGDTGSFWQPDKSVPVLAQSALMKLIRLFASP